MEEIVLGYTLAKPVETQDECTAYAAMAQAVNEHNAACGDSDTRWMIEDGKSGYTVAAIVPIELTIEEIRENKLKLMSDSCGELIRKGIDVSLSDGKKHFSLETTDQTNINGVFNAVTLGATSYPYHADGEPCKMFSAADIVALYVEYKSFVTEQTTYCNALRQWIKRETDKAILSKIEYGTMLPDDLKEKTEEILKEANNQITALVAKISAASSN